MLTHNTKGLTFGIYYEELLKIQQGKNDENHNRKKLVKNFKPVLHRRRNSNGQLMKCSSSLAIRKCKLNHSEICHPLTRQESEKI